MIYPLGMCTYMYMISQHMPKVKQDPVVVNGIFQVYLSKLGLFSESGFKST